MGKERERFGLPTRAFLYTLDQVAMMLDMRIETLRSSYIHFADRSPGPRQHEKIEAKNIALEGEKPDWRVAENEFIRWLRYKGFRVYTRGWATR